ncbi:MAG: phosphoribosylamine--glycine ligase [Pseudomonadota bacterium]
MNVLILGGGGREHALAWALSASPLLDNLYCAPGNAGIAQVANCVALSHADHAGIAAFCQRENIELVVVGPEAPLVDGVVDSLQAASIKTFGPSKAAAQLEASKGFTKDFCQEFNIPTARYNRFSDAEAARAYVREQELPIVIKADGLAAGKGVIIANHEDDAMQAIDMCFGGSFGDAGSEVVIEEFLMGEEASFFALVDGTTAVPLATAQDHKRVGDGDTGPNTGGMGAYSPAPILTQDVCDRVMAEIIEPTVRGMSARGTPFKGVLYAGLMIDAGAPKLIEYNVRFGDPECQVLMMRLKSDLLPALIATCDGVLANFDMRWHDDAALTVVMAANGYPAAPETGSEIEGLASIDDDAVEVFHAGTANEDGRIIATGGRVLNVTAVGTTVSEAQTKAYSAIDNIEWPGGFCRRDIGWRAVQRES